MDFKEWITQKYREWRGDAVGRERSIKDFAKWVDVSQSLMSEWMSGKIIPTHQSSISKLVHRFGNEVYTVLRFEPPANLDIFPINPDLEECQRLLSKLDPDKLQKAKDYLKNLMEPNREVRGFEPLRAHIWY